jgi:hypothetical protein
MKPKTTTAGPRPKSKTARKSKPDWFDSVDRIHGCCRAVEMLGRLLEGQGDEPVAPEAVREAGGALVGQVEQLRAALADLGAAR